MFKIPAFRNLLLVSVGTVSVLMAYHMLYTHPSFESMLTKNTEAEAVRVGRNLMSILFPKKDIGSLEEIPVLTIEKIKERVAEFNLAKLKIFSSSGKIIYSTDEKDIGEINKKPYFLNVVAKGIVYTKMVQKNTNSSEGQVISSDVVETYVPIMQNNNFMGAFEIYYDISNRTAALDNLFLRSTITLACLSLMLLTALITVLVQSTKNITARVEAERRFRTLFEFANECIFLIKAEAPQAGSIVAANQAASKIYGYSVPELLSLKITDLQTKHSRLSATHIKRLLKGGKLTSELVRVKKNGTEFPAEMSLGSLDLGGEKYVIEMGRDITQRKQAEKKLISLATTDSLTGAYNRRHFLEKAQEELIRARRYATPLAFLMLDIDHFKQINDNFGHHTGDEVLKAFVAKSQTTLRQTDIFGRIGGEEFAAVLVETDNDIALSVAERLRDAIAGLSISTETEPVTLTVSIGLTILRKEGDTFVEDVMKRTDQALYDAKDQGRNRVVQWS